VVRSTHKYGRGSGFLGIKPITFHLINFLNHKNMAQAATKAPSGKANNTLLWVVILVIAILIGAVVVYLLATKSPGKSEAANYAITFPTGLTTDINTSASTCSYQSTPLQLQIGQTSCILQSNNILPSGTQVSSIDLIQQLIVPLGTSVAYQFSTDGNLWMTYNGPVNIASPVSQLFYRLQINSTLNSGFSASSWSFSYSASSPPPIHGPKTLTAADCG